MFHWFYNFVVPKLFSSNVLIVFLSLFVFLFILMLYNIRLIRSDIFSVHRTSLRVSIYIYIYIYNFLRCCYSIDSDLHSPCAIPICGKQSKTPDNPLSHSMIYIKKTIQTCFPHKSTINGLDLPIYQPCHFQVLMLLRRCTLNLGPLKLCEHRCVQIT